MIVFAAASAEPFRQAPSHPTYDRTLQLETASDKTANVSVGDVNGDGRLDLVEINGRHWPGTSRVLLGDGHGHFPTAYALSDTQYRSYSGNLVDLDGDGSLDVILSNDHPDPKPIYLNDGKGHFHLAGTYGQEAWETRNAAVADLDGDGRPDIVVANRSEHPTQYVCLNHGRGHFGSTCLAFADYSATTITAVDMNRDGKIDLVVPNRDWGQSYVFLNGGSASFSKAHRIPFGPPDATIRMASVADLDGDGALDIVAIDDEHRTVEICYGTKAGGFGAATPLDAGTVTPYALLVTDLDRDGYPDIIVGHVQAPSNVFFGEGKRHYSRATFGDSQGAVYGFAVADLDADGHLDIAAARSDAPNMIYFGDVGKP